MWKWFHHLLNPHCPDCKLERAEQLEREAESKVCKSCEVLQYEIERLRAENQTLLNKILTPEVREPERVKAPAMQQLPRRIPWAVRQQMLEAEDRKRAQLMKQAPVPENSVAELEKELDVVTQERENATTAAGTTN